MRKSIIYDVCALLIGLIIGYASIGFIFWCYFNRGNMLPIALQRLMSAEMNKHAAFNRNEILRHARSVKMPFLSFVALLLTAFAAMATNGIDCDCTNVGSYIAPDQGVEPQFVATSGDSSTSPNGIYRVTTNLTGSIVNLVVTRISTGATLLTESPPASSTFGFSPDDDRFVIQYMDGSTHNVALYTLTGSNAAPVFAPLAVVTGSSRVQFSSHGEYFFYSALTSQSHTALSIYDVRTGSLAYQNEFTFSVPPGSPGDDFGVATWGFSPDSQDRTFVYAWVSGQSSVEFTLVNLERNLVTGSSGANVHNETILSTAFWQFSRCGDLLGIVTQGNQTQIGVRLFRTVDGTRITSPYETFPLAAVTLRTTPPSQIANVGGTDYIMSTNAANSSCSTPPGTNAPPTVAFTVPTLVRQGVPATFTDDSTDSDGTIAAWVWQFGDGSTSTQQNPTHTYASSGSFNVRLDVTDDKGATNALAKTVNVRSNMPPQASFTYTPVNPMARDIVTFTDTSTDDDGIASRYWSFGLSEASVQLKVCDTIEVSLTVYDNAGQSDTVLQTISVAPPTDPEVFVPAGASLADAVAQACPGDILRLDAGTFAGGVRLVDVTLRGAGPGKTIISGGVDDTSGWVIISDPSRGITNTIRDLTITGGGGVNAFGVIEGGGVSVKSRTRLLNVSVSQNLGSGGILASGNTADLELVDSLVVSNRAEQSYRGGGITIDCCGKAIIKDTEIAFNVSTNGGEAGGMADLEGDQMIITGSYFHHNISSGSGGGLSLNSYGRGDLVANSRFIENTAEEGGGVQIGSHPRVLFVGNLVAGNAGGGVWDGAFTSKLIVINSTIVNNGGPGLISPGATILNSIVDGNDVNLDGTPVRLEYSLIGTAPGFQGGGDYHLAAGSSAIDAGDNSLIPQSPDYPDLLALEPDLATIFAHDADGELRILDGDGDGTAQVDIGYAESAGIVLAPSLHIERSGNDIVVSWSSPGAILQNAPTVKGPWTDVLPSATSPYSINASTLSVFYRLRF
jgi:PKD repeat protein